MIAIFCEELAPGACSLEARFWVKWGLDARLARLLFLDRVGDTV